MNGPQTINHRPRPSAECGVRSAESLFRTPNSDFRTAVVGGLLSVVCGLFTSGCVTRSLTIRTEPPGAMVYVNDQLKGTSPLTYDFMWYGWHRVILRKAGFERLEDRKQIIAPFYMWIPFDLVVELLPVKIRDMRNWSYTLTPTRQLPTPIPPQLTDNKEAPTTSAVEDQQDKPGFVSDQASQTQSQASGASGVNTTQDAAKPQAKERPDEAR